MDLRAILMGLAFVLMWSSAFTSARIIVTEAPPITALTLRFLVSGGLALAIALALGQSWRLTRAQWRATVVFGICQNALYLGLNFVAMQTVQASVAVIVGSLLPLLVAVAGRVFFDERLPLLAYGGLLAGFGGVSLIMIGRIDAGLDLWGLALCGGAVLALTFATLTVRSASSGGNLLMIVGLQMLIGAVPLALLAVTTETLAITLSWRLVLAFAYTVLFPGLVATLVWFLLVNRIGATRAATFHFLNPFFGVLIAAVILDEALGPRDLVGVVIVAGGILAVQLARQRPG